MRYSKKTLDAANAVFSDAIGSMGRKWIENAEDFLDEYVEYAGDRNGLAELVAYMLAEEYDRRMGILTNYGESSLPDDARKWLSEKVIDQLLTDGCQYKPELDFHRGIDFVLDGRMMYMCDDVWFLVCADDMDFDITHWVDRSFETCCCKIENLENVFLKTLRETGRIG